MAQDIGHDQHRQLIEDIFNAEHDVVALAAAHGLSPKDLADWIEKQENQRCLAGLCVLADLQTQLMLSRYRLVAVTKLIRQATQQEADISAEQARKACVDLLKLDLKRADLQEAATTAQRLAEETAGDDLAQLRALLYGEREKDEGAGQKGQTETRAECGFDREIV